MKDKIKHVNDIFDKYDPIGVHYGLHNYTDEYVHISSQFVIDASKLGAAQALHNAMITMFTDTKHCRKYAEIHDKMLVELKHVIR